MDEASLVTFDDSAVKVSPVGLVFTGEISFDNWASIGPMLGKYSRAVAWAIGDWLNFGEAKWGEMYAQALDTTGLSLGRLRNLKYLAGAVPMTNRVSTLSLSHHEAVASFPIDRQSQLLRMATDYDLNRDELRAIVKEVEAGIGLNGVEEHLVVQTSAADDQTIADKARQVARVFARERTGVWPGSMSLWEELNELCELLGDEYGET